MGQHKTNYPEHLAGDIQKLKRNASDAEADFWSQVQKTHLFVTVTYQYNTTEDKLKQDVKKFADYLSFKCLGRHTTMIGYYDVQPGTGDKLHAHLFIEISGGLEGLQWKRDKKNIIDISSWDQLENLVTATWKHGIADCMPYLERKKGITYAHLYHGNFFSEYQSCPGIKKNCKKSHIAGIKCSHNQERSDARHYHNDHKRRKLSL